MLCDLPVVRDKIMKMGYTVAEFAKTICTIAKTMILAERRNYDKRQLLDKTKELEELCDANIDMLGLQVVLDTLEPQTKPRKNTIPKIPSVLETTRHGKRKCRNCQVYVVWNSTCSERGLFYMCLYCKYAR